MSYWPDRIKREIISNKGNCEAYVYEYEKTNEPDLGKKYVGYHKGEPERDYSNSSMDDYFKKLLADDDSTWTYRVLVYGTKDYCIQFEHDELTRVNAKDNPKYYNKTNGQSKNIDIVRDDYFHDMAQQILNYKSLDGCNTILRDKNYIKNNVEFFQVRAETTDEKHDGEIRTRIDESHGDYAKKHLLITILKNRAFKGDRANLAINGNHSWHAFRTSKSGILINTLEIPEEIHKNWNDSEVKEFADYLNPIKMHPTKSSDLETIARLALDRVKTGLSVDSVQMEDYFKKKNLTYKDMKKVKQTMDKIENHDDNKINWKSAGYVKLLKKLEDSYSLDDGIYCKSFSSSKNDMIGKFGLVKLKRLKEEHDIKRFHVIIHHPVYKTEEAKKQWAKDKKENSEILEDIFNNQTDSGMFKGIKLTFEEVPVWREDLKKLVKDGFNFNEPENGEWKNNENKA